MQAIVMTQSKDLIAQARIAREQARELLQALLDTQRILDNQTSRDLYKKVTGQSSLEKSIASARRLIETYDRVIGDGGSALVVAPPQTRTIRPAPSSGFASTYAARTA
jgi:hypothetical protein